MWAEDGRVGPGMMVQDLLSGQTMVASAVPGLSFAEQAGPHVNYPRTEQQAQSAGNTSVVAMILGLVGLLAWCLPIVGLPVGAGALIFGLRSLKSEGRTMALVGVVLGSLCLALSLANAILGAILYTRLNQ
jgi:hypothetical protein